MKNSLSAEFKKHREPSHEGTEFLTQLESSIAQDLWQSAGGHWSEESISRFRVEAMLLLSKNVLGDSQADYRQAWTQVVRDFHQNFWNEQRLAKKEKKEKTPEQKVFWELFSYIWMLLQAVFVTKTAVFYFGIKSANEDSSEGKIYVLLAILFSFGSLMFFAYRKSKKDKAGDDK